MSKPVLSELEYNASDVASAILENADLSVTNQDFGVSEVSDSFDVVTNWTDNNRTKAFKFNGFIYLQFSCYKLSAPTNGEQFAEVSDSDLYPDYIVTGPTVSEDGESAHAWELSTDGEFKLVLPHTAGDSAFRVFIMAWYRVG